MNVTKQTVDLSLKHCLVHTHFSVLLLSDHGSSTATLHSVLGSVNSPLTEKGMCSGQEQGQVSRGHACVTQTLVLITNN